MSDPVSGCRWYNPCSWFNSCCAPNDNLKAEREPFAHTSTVEQQRPPPRSHSPEPTLRTPSDKGTPTRYGQADVIESGQGTPPL